MHILLVFQHYHTPDCPTAARPYALVERLAREHEVTLLTTRAWREKRHSARFPWVPPGVRLIELRVPYANEMGAARRLQTYFSFAAKAAVRGLAVPQPDLVFGSSTPLTAAVAAAAIARLHHVPWVFEVRDLWPDFPVQMGALPRWLARSLYALERRLYRSAAHVVAASPDMARQVRRRCPSAAVTTVPYGTDFRLLDAVSKEEVAALREELDLGGRQVVLYAGSFGRSNDIPTLLEAARRLKDRADSVFLLAGYGYHATAVDEAARTLPNVRRLPPQPYWRTLALFRLAALSVASFIDLPVLAANAPSKFFDSLAAGTPVIVTNPGWTRSFVEEHGCGWYVPPESPEALARMVAGALDRPDELKTRGQRGAQAARTHFDRAQHMDRLAALLADVAGK